MNMAAEYQKYSGEILEKDIAGRLEALRAERALIDQSYEIHGRNPIGNKYPKR